MKLFYAPGSCALAPHIALEEIGQPYTAERVDLATKTLASDGSDFHAINPRGAVPALEMAEGGYLTQTTAILQYLGDRSDIEALKPAAGTLARARLQEALGITGDLHSAMGGFFAPGLDEASKARVTAGVMRRLGQIDAALPQEGYWFGEFSVADAYTFTVLSWTGFLQIDISAYPKLGAYLGHVAQRPSVQAALKAQGLI